MPEISSIQRRVNEDGLNDSLRRLALDGGDDDAEQDQADVFNFPEVPTFSIPALTLAFDVEHVDFDLVKDNIARHRETGEAPSTAEEPILATAPKEYLLGIGASSTIVLLQTPKDTREERPSETLTAFKRYNVVPGDDISNKKVHRWLWHELNALCNPGLRRHENICKLKYIAWEGTNILPILALELAHFGTLEDCLSDLRKNGSSELKSHLTLDIALGIEAIHSAGLVHGDLKPKNILVSYHPTRIAVAMISDLTGVAPATSYGSNEFAVMTRTWQSPEAITLDPNTDWQLADVYSFGMVVVSIWSPFDEAFMTLHIQYELDESSRNAEIDTLKFTRDEESNSIIQSAYRAVAATSDTELPLRQIIESTLSSRQRKRTPLKAIIDTQFAPWANNAGRDITTSFSDHSSQGDFYHTNDNNGWGYLWQFGEGHLTSVSTLFPVLLAASEKFRDSLNFDAVSDLDEYSLDKEKELWSYIVYHDSIDNQRMRESDTRRRLVALFFILSMGFTWGRGTRVDKQAGLHWLSLGAHLGNWSLKGMFCLFEETAEQRLPLPLPRKLWAAIALLRGQGYAGRYLKAQDPLLHDFILRKAELGGFNVHGRGSPATVHGEPVKMTTDPHHLYGANKETSLHVAAYNGDVAAVQRLRDAGADINATTTRNETPIFQALRGGKIRVTKLLYERGAASHHLDHKGCSAIHLLCSIDDAEAVELAPLLVMRGARLDSPANESETPENLQGEAKGVPLSWAGRKGRPLLFEVLVELHCMPAHRLSLGRYFSLLKVLSKFHKHQMLSLIIAKKALLVDSALGFRDTTSSDDNEGLMEVVSLLDLSSTNDASSLGLSSLRPHLYYRALIKALDSDGMLAIFNRMAHGTAFRQVKSKTIELLLASGVDLVSPLNSNKPHMNALFLAIVRKDTEAFRHFIEHMKSNYVDILAVLSDWRRFVGRNALQRAIDADARGIFILLLELCPSLVQQADSVGCTALHIAVRQKWPEYTQDLIRQGACPYTTAGNRLRPLVQALVKNPDTQAATEIADALLRAGERQRILGPDDKSGNTALGDLLASRPLNADRVRHFIDNYGPHDYYTNTAAPKTVFQCLLRNHSLPSNINACYQKNKALEMLLEAFPGRTNETMAYVAGFFTTPLHIAAWFGNVEAVKILIQHGADLDLETESANSRMMNGLTAIGLSLLRRHWGAPEWVAQAGRQEIQVFSKNLESTINFLVQSGSRTAGRGAYDAIQMDLDLAIDPSLGRVMGRTHSILGHPADQERRRTTGDWPKRMPLESRDNLSSQLDDFLVQLLGNSKHAAQPPEGYVDQLYERLSEAKMAWENDK